ncbi:hypothetical protein [Oceanobacillus jeddahense]|uniref:FbpB family small basic protein n=1 Tax=Oceanobacillus jeddahense TaxID=1462527 RepID=A0ABY5JZW1_9BACI|nr:hypothetical protein [Oceanobacillus jeddahense]UUI04059.1 hypothetical protein NP439_05050 [Oceanobacillus jeddahense]
MLKKLFKSKRKAQQDVYMQNEEHLLRERLAVQYETIRAGIR